MHVILKNDSNESNPNFSFICEHKSQILRLQKFKRLKTMLYMLGVNYNGN